MLNALVVKKDSIELLEVDIDNIHNDEYVCNLLGINKTITSSVIRTINDCYFRIYCQDLVSSPKWFSGVHKKENKIYGDIPEEAIFIPIDRFINDDGELDEEPLNAEILFDFVLADRVGKVKLDSGEETSAILLD